VRVDGRPVAVFYQLAVKPPSGKPLSDLLPPEPRLTAIDGELRAGQWKEAQGKAWGFWRKSIAVAAKHGRPGLAAALALEALADAGIGKEGEAICRWQAAQTLDPEIYHADLSAYGAAGALLERNRWGELLPALADGAAAEAPTRDRQPIPKSLVRLGIEGTVMVGAVVDERGSLRQPVVLSASHPRTVQRDMLEAGTLEAVCAWSYHPATLSGRPVAVAQTVPFRTGTWVSVGGLPPSLGEPRKGVERMPRPEPLYGPDAHPPSGLPPP
jgi:TonB family protein